VSRLSRRGRALVIVGAVLIAAVLVLAACGGGGGGGSASPTSETPKAGGTYNYPLGAEPVYVDPLNGNYETEGTSIENQIFQGLVTYDQKDADSPLTVEPCIAESWESNADATVWTFHLKKGVMFQAPVSREVKAQDFLDEWTRVTLEKNASNTSYIMAPIVGVNESGYQVDPAKGLTGVKVIDDYTLEVTLQYAFAEFPVTLGHMVAAVAPVDYINQVGPEAFNKKPVGTGQYMMENWVPNQYVDLVKNPDYWDKANAGYVDRIHMPIIPDDQTMLLEFKKGNLDYTEIPAGQIASTQADPNVANGTWLWKKWTGMNVYYVGYNLKDPVLGYSAGDKGLKLREALNLASDRETLNNTVNEGVNTVADGIVPSTISGYQKGTDPYAKYDLEQAKSLMAEVGTVPELQYWYNTESTGHQKIAEFLQAGWKEIGVTTKLQGFEWGTFLAKVKKGDGDQIFRMGWFADYPSIDNFLYPLFQSKQVAFNDEFYNNPQVDQLLQEARGIVDDQQRWAKYVEAQKIIHSEAPVNVLYWYGNPRITQSRIGGFVYDAMGFVDMWKVWVK
jgi:oligopeptide transport system substrate-binding protein